MPVVCCPDCWAAIDLRRDVRSGDVVECPNCAGHALRVREEGGRWFATLAHRVSCPNCNGVLTLPEAAKPGNFVQCCGRGYRLTFEYGAFAAEEPWEDAMWRDRWFAVGVIGTMLSCAVCLTPLAAVALAAIGVDVWAGHLDAVLLPVLVVFLAVAVYRHRVACRRAS